MLPRVQRFASRLLAVLAFAALAVHAFLSVPVVVRVLSARAAEEVLPAALPIALALVLQLLVGRLVLSFLPPGDPGSHGLSGLTATLATSFFLGEVALELEQRLWPTELGGLGWALFLFPWMLLALARLVTLPGAMVPRHEVAHERAGPATRLVRVLVLGWSLALLWLTGIRFAWSWFAFLAVADHALSSARRAPLGRTLVVLGGALTAAPLLWGHPVRDVAVRLGFGAVFLVPWIRRAERRALVLAIIACSSLAGVGEPVLALAGLVTVLVLAPAPQRRRVLATGVVAAALLVLPWIGFASAGERAGPTAIREPAVLEPLGPDPWRASDALSAALDIEDWGIAWLFLVLVGFAELGIVAGRIALLLERRGQTWSEERIEEPLREVLGLAVLFVLAYCALRVSRTPCADAASAVLVLFPVVLLLSGLVLVPAERPPDSTSARSP